MQQLAARHLVELLAPREGPCISLYQPTHRRHPQNQQDPIRFKNLVRSVEDSLREKYPRRDIRDLIAPFDALSADALFWRHTRDGLAIFAAPGLLEVHQLQRSMPELAIVADSFHIKPLLRHLQSADSFHVLALTRDSAAIYRGNRYVLDAEPLDDDFPAKLEQVVPPERGERGVSVASTSAGLGSSKMLRGHNEGKADQDTEKFFVAVDRAVAERFSNPVGLPLVLAALPEHQALFRRLAQNPALLGDGVQGNPLALGAEQLREQVWQVLLPRYLARLERLKEDFNTAQARHAGAADLADVARAAVQGRVGLLLLEADRVVPGVIDRGAGAIQAGSLAAPDVGDMLDDLAELVLARGGEVVVVPAERMPAAAAASGLAAIYRY
jgi:hypothetical protein